MAEAHFAHGEITFPHPAKLFAEPRDRGVPVGAEALPPMAEGHGVVEAEDLDIGGE